MRQTVFACSYFRQRDSEGHFPRLAVSGGVPAQGRGAGQERGFFRKVFLPSLVGLPVRRAGGK